MTATDVDRPSERTHGETGAAPVAVASASAFLDLRPNRDTPREIDVSHIHLHGCTRTARIPRWAGTRDSDSDSTPRQSRPSASLAPAVIVVALVASRSVLARPRSSDVERVAGTWNRPLDLAAIVQ